MRPRLAVDLRESPLGEVPARVLLCVAREDRRVDVVVGVVGEVHAQRRETGKHVGVGVAAGPSDGTGAHAAPNPVCDRAAAQRRGGEGRVPALRAVDEQGRRFRAAKAVRERRARAEREVAPVPGPVRDLAVRHGFHVPPDDGIGKVNRPADGSQAARQQSRVCLASRETNRFAHRHCLVPRRSLFPGKALRRPLAATCASRRRTHYTTS